MYWEWGTWAAEKKNLNYHWSIVLKLRDRNNLSFFWWAGIYVWIHRDKSTNSLSTFSAKGGKTDFSSLHRLAVEPELNAVFCLFCPPGDRNIPKYAFQCPFCLSNKTIKKEENKREKAASSRRHWFPAGFNLGGLSAAPSLARGCETRITV